MFDRLLDSEDSKFSERFDLKFAATPTPVHILRDGEVMERKRWEEKEKPRRRTPDEGLATSRVESRKRKPSAVPTEWIDSVKSVVDDMMSIFPLEGVD